MDLHDVRAVNPKDTLQCDVCIVGSGPVGLTLAAELSGKGLDIVVLESGGRTSHKDSDELNSIESVGAPRRSDQTKLRNRIFGGTSHSWAGRIAAFDEIDFSERSWVPFSGWPISRAELLAYLPRTLDHIGGAVADNNDRAVVKGLLRGQAGLFDPNMLNDYIWTRSQHDNARLPFMPVDFMRFGPKAVGSSMPDVRCFLHATLVHIDTVDGGSAVSALEIKGLDGHSRFIKPRSTVLCGGGIENARMMLASRGDISCGIGNKFDQVGRYLMDHPRGCVGVVHPRDLPAVQSSFGSLYRVVGRRTSVVTRGVALSRSMQERHKLLNCAVYYNGIVSYDDIFASAARLMQLKEQPHREVGNILKRSPLLLRAAYGLMVQRRAPPRQLQTLELLAITEQLPNPDSRVTLSHAKDGFGVPISRIDWKLHEVEDRTIKVTARLFAAECHRLGLPTAQLFPEIMTDDIPLNFLDVAHPMGTTRMSSGPRNGVVDANCAVHGVRGLFVCGTSVFSTSGHANPTQTALALAIRLADHLGEVLGTGRALISPASSGRSRPSPEEVDGGTLAPTLPFGYPPVDERTPGPHRILVTGASGGVGSRALSALMSRGYHVRALTSRALSSKRQCSGDPGVEWVVRDLRQNDFDFREVVEGCDAVIHLGAEMTAVEDMPTINGVATGAMARAAERSGTRFMCYISSAAVYGSSVSEVITEDSATVAHDIEVPGQHLVNEWMRAYARSKRFGEVSLLAEVRKVKYTIFRPTVIVNTDQIASVVGWNKALRRLQSRRNAHHIFIDDAVEAMIWAMERALSSEVADDGVSIYNLADNTLQDPTYQGIFDQAQKELGKVRVPDVSLLPRLIDWSRDYVRYGLGHKPRRTMPYMRFSTDRLAAKGFKMPFGMEYARNKAIDTLCSTASRGGGSTALSGGSER